MSNQYTQAITSFNGLNQTDNTNSSFIAIGNNMDSQHYPYLSPCDYLTSGSIIEDDYEPRDIKEIDGVLYRTVRVKFYNASSKYETIELLLKGDTVIPYIMHVNEESSSSVQCSSFIKVGTNWVVNGQLEIVPMQDGIGYIRPYCAKHSFISGYYSRVTKNIGGQNRLGFKCNSGYVMMSQALPLSEKLALLTNELGKDGEYSYDFVYAYENLVMPSTLTTEEQNNHSAYISNCTYTKVIKVLLTNKQTLPSGLSSEEYCTFYQYMQGINTTYDYFNIYVGAKNDATQNIGTEAMVYPFLEKGNVSYKNGALTVTDIQATNKKVYFNRARCANMYLKEVSTDYSAKTSKDIFTYELAQDLPTNTKAFNMDFDYARNLQVGDTVIINKCNTDLYTDYTTINAFVMEIQDDAIYFDLIANGTFEIDTTKNYTVRRYLPKFDYYCGHKNRMYAYANSTTPFALYTNGVANYKVPTSAHTIYISSLGYPWQFLTYDSNIDAYSVVDTNQSDCSAMVEYNDMVLLMKEKAIEKIIGDLPSNYQVYSYDFIGPYSWFRSVCKVNERIYYFGSDFKVYMYSGGEPQCISNVMNEFVPKYKLSQEGNWDGNTKIETKYYTGSYINYAYGFEFNGEYHLGFMANLYEGLKGSYQYDSFKATYKYDSKLNQWFRVSDKTIYRFEQSDSNKYRYYYRTSRDGGNPYKTHSVSKLNFNRNNIVNDSFYAILAPTNMGNMRLKHFKRMRVRFECITNEPSDRINVGYAIDNERILHTSKMPINERTVLEIPIDKVGEEITIGFEGNGIIVIKGIEIDYEVLENIR